MRSLNDLAPKPMQASENAHSTKILNALQQQAAFLERIAEAVEQMALAHKPVVIPRGATIDHSAAKPWGGVTVGGVTVDHFDADGTR